MLHANMDPLPMHFSLMYMRIFTCSPLIMNQDPTKIHLRSSVGKILSEERPNLAFSRLSVTSHYLSLVLLCSWSLLCSCLLVLQILVLEQTWPSGHKSRCSTNYSKSQDVFASVKWSLLSALHGKWSALIMQLWPAILSVPQDRYIQTHLAQKSLSKQNQTPNPKKKNLLLLPTTQHVEILLRHFQVCGWRTGALVQRSITDKLSHTSDIFSSLLATSDFLKTKLVQYLFQTFLLLDTLLCKNMMKMQSMPPGTDD